MGDEPFFCIQYKLAEVVLDYRRNLFGARRRDRQPRRAANSQAPCLWGYYGSSNNDMKPGDCGSWRIFTEPRRSRLGAGGAVAKETYRRGASIWVCVCRLERDKELFRFGCIGDDALDKKGYYYSLTVDGDGCK